MIAKEFEDFLLAHLDNYLIPSDQVAILLIAITLIMWFCF